jgi:glyoxylase-like metal-dependent hydrolase (beta-lactamase superfamily II)
MKRTELTRNTTAYLFDEIEDYYTCVFLIEKKSTIFVIDTFCGSISMEPILRHLARVGKGKQVIVVNTHFHWDHVWGNVAFQDRTIIGHRFCYEDLATSWQSQIDNRGRYRLGRVERVLPSLTFDQSLRFPAEKIEIFHSPGHTRDSISIFDHEEGALYVGDNVETPIIYVEAPDVDTYIQTLEHYLARSARKIFGSHTLEITPADIENSIDYLKKLKTGTGVEFRSEYEKTIHSQNLSMLK